MRVSKDWEKMKWIRKYSSKQSESYYSIDKWIVRKYFIKAYLFFSLFMNTQVQWNLFAKPKECDPGNPLSGTSINDLKKFF